MKNEAAAEKVNENMNEDVINEEAEGRGGVLRGERHHTYNRELGPDTISVSLGVSPSSWRKHSSIGALDDPSCQRPMSGVVRRAGVSHRPVSQTSGHR